MSSGRSAGTPGAVEPPPHIHDHELLCPIGQGSYGEVWLARNAVGTLRAVKIVHRQRFERVEHFGREFKGLQKFEPISRSHDGLVDILQIGRDDAPGYFYYVMELADAVETAGGKVGKWESESQTPPTNAVPQRLNPETYTPKTLRSLLSPAHFPTCPPAWPSSLPPANQIGLPVADCIEIGLALASALEHLHKNGLVHRDIKPSNIIFVNGAPKLADIGLVAHIDDARSLVGTAGYIPPEGPGSVQADLYSLGKVLYEISLGKDRQDFPQLPPDLQSHPDHAALLELNEVILKACETDFRKRYQTAKQMHDDLAILQCGRSIKHKRASERRLALTKKFSISAAAVGLMLAGLWFARERFGQPPDRSSKEQLSKSWKPSPEAKNLYDEGWSHLRKQTKDGISRSIDCFNRAIELEPNYALAYCGLSDAYYSQSEASAPPIQAMPEARKNARRAVEIDVNLPDGHVYLGYALMGAYDFVGAEIEFKQAVALGPSNSWMHSSYATLLRCLLRTEQAGELQKKAFKLEPSERLRIRGWYYQLWSERKFDEAARQAEHLTLVASDWAMTPWFLGRAYAACGRLEDAARELSRARTVDDDPDGAGGLGYVYGRMGKTNAARAVLDELKHWSRSRHVCPHAEAYVYAGLGETAEAIRQLQLAYENQCRVLTALHIEPFWDDLRSDARFQALRRKVGLPEFEPAQGRPRTEK